MWNTHWHPDHTGGNAEIQAMGARVSGPAAEFARIPTLDVHLREGDRVSIGNVEADVIATPGHTAGHISFHLGGEGIAFTGDTLFAMGCGRLFEGTAAEMYANMQRYAVLSPETRVYCGHEYTLSNGRYALVAEPNNAALVERMAAVEAMRAKGEATVPTTIGAELATNPFLRSRSVEELARHRAAKDAF